LDYEAAIQKVGEYLELWREGERIYRRRQDPYAYLSDPEYNSLLSKMNARIGLVEGIARQVDDRLAMELRQGSSYGWDYSRQRSPLEELLGRLEGFEEQARILGPTGPQLAAAQLHPWVWNAAADLWNGGHYVHAVIAASAALFDSHLPAKLGVAKQGGATDRIGKAFSLKDPAPNEPRLRFRSLAKLSDDWKSAHDGAGAFGRGCAMGIRNVTDARGTARRAASPRSARRPQPPGSLDRRG
jgi:hypothetical protein